MPLFSYFAFMGSVLLALLFVADATLEKSTPMHVSAFVGLPKTYEHKNGPSLSTVPVPAPDMSSDAVRAASVVTAATATEPAAPRAPEIVPKKNNVALKRSRGDGRQNFAWSRNENSLFGRRLFIGRF